MTQSISFSLQIQGSQSQVSNTSGTSTIASLEHIVQPVLSTLLEASSDLGERAVTSSPLLETENIRAVGEELLGVDSSVEKRRVFTIVDQWIEEVPVLERSFRIRAKEEIKGFLEQSEKDLLKLSFLGLWDLPDIWVSPFLSTRMRSLNLSVNKLKEVPDSIGQLTALKSLDLSDNHIKKIPDFIRQLTVLTKLCLSHDDIEDIPESLSLVTALTHLDLSANKIQLIPDFIKELKVLKYLDLFGNKITEIPDSIGALTALQMLNLSRNHIQLIPDFLRQLTALKRLALSENQLQAIPSSIGQLTPLIKLDLSENQISIISDAIGQLTVLQELRLFKNQLRSIPDTIGHLTALIKLDLSENQIRMIPEFIGQLTVLQELNLSKNQLQSIPDIVGHLTALITLDVSKNQLRSIPDSIGQLTAIKNLYFSYNLIQSIPGFLGRLSARTYLDFAYNNLLTSLPIEFLQLPSSCSINIEGCNLSTQILLRLRETCNAPGYIGPRIHYSMAHTEARAIDTRTVEGLLDELYQITGKARLSFSEKFMSSRELKDWLSRISYMADFRVNRGEKRGIVARKVLEFLELAANPAHPEFQEVFFGVVENATRSCGDSMSLSLLHLGIARRLSLLEPGNLKGLATLLLKGTWALSQLEEFARSKVRVLRFVDEIEVYLAYPIRLKERLELPIDVDEMLYFRCSGLTEEDLQIAEDSVRDNLQNKEKACDFLSSQELWTSTLDRLGFLEALKTKRAEKTESARTEEEWTVIQQEYQSGVRVLTGRILADCGFVFEQEGPPHKKQKSS